MTQLFANFARSAVDFESLQPGQTLLVGMPGSALAGQVLFYSETDFEKGNIILRNISQTTDEKFSDVVKQMLGKTLTNKNDDRPVIKAGSFEENDGYILTGNDWAVGEKLSPYECGYYFLFADENVLDIIAEGFGPKDFLIMRGAVVISTDEVKDLLDRNIIVGIDAHPDLVFSETPYEDALEHAVHQSVIHDLAAQSQPKPKP